MNAKAALSFLDKLRKNNNKEWFDANKKEYESVKKDWTGMVASLIKEIGKFDKPIAELEPKKCMFRINRDIRFSKDKSPYKTNMGASFSKGAKTLNFAGYYFHLEAGNKSFLAGGMYMPEPEHLKAVRQEIDYNLQEFEKILKNKDFVKYFNKLDGDKLQTVPKGYDKDNPAIEYLKHKSFLMVHNLTDKDLNSPDLLKNAVTVFKAMKPLNDFINRSLEK